jgi:hypothetical protein
VKNVSLIGLLSQISICAQIETSRPYRQTELTLKVECRNSEIKSFLSGRYA